VTPSEATVLMTWMEGTGAFPDHLPAIQRAPPASGEPAESAARVGAGKYQPFALPVSGSDAIGGASLIWVGSLIWVEGIAPA
jgi:hypothetical protein